VALNGGKEPTLSVPATPTFKDVRNDANSAWAEKYIESCVAQGIVGGVGNGMFQPSQNVTGSQLAKMLLVALGYRADEEKFGGAAWDTNVNVIATQKGLYEDLETIDVSAALSRDSAAQMIWNALQAKEVKYEYTLISENGQLVSKVNVVDKAISLQADKYGVIDDQAAIMIGFTYNDDKDEWTYKLDTGIYTGTNTTTTTVVSDVDYTDLFQQNVKVVYTVKNNKIDTVYGMFAYDSSVIAEGVLGDIDAADLADKSIEIADVDYDTTGTTVAAYAFNGAADGSPINATYKTPATALGYSMKAIDNTGDDKIDAVVYVPFTVEEVTYLGATTITTKNVNGGATNNIKKDDINLANGIAEDDYVMIVNKANTIDGVAAYTELEVLSGKVSAVKGTDVKVGDTWYTLANGQTMTLDVEYDFVVVDGYVYFADATSSEVDVADYALVTAFQTTTDWNASYPQVSLLTSTGEIITVPYDSNASNGVAKNALVYIDEIDDGVYTLTTTVPPISDTTAKGDLAYDKDSGKAGGYPVADDAVIFVVDTTETPNTYKVITGADLKKTDDGTLNNTMVKENDATGFTSVVFATMASTLATSDDTAYGYVIADLAKVKDADKNTVYEITLADGTVLTTKNGVDVTGIDKGSIISYKVTDGKVTTLSEIADTNGTTTGGASVVAYDGKLIQFASDTKTYEITDDTEILYINSANVAAAEGGKISLAQKDSSDNYVANAAYQCTCKNANSDGNWEIELLVIDVNNNIYDANII
ncbi:MAG: S-layer homology domain-containing protein, partial [Clostridiales bacterium]|nr:S-layer homology domain-containing protein [Clostridiales bacterium]